MKRVLFTIFFILPFIYCAAHATTCVPHKHESPPADSQKYLQYHSDSYALCNGENRGTFENCPVGTIANGWDGNLHECTNRGWKIINIDKINMCDSDLAKVEKQYNGNSNLGVLASNEEAQQDWIIYSNPTTNSDNYIGLKDYCKYSQTEFDKQLNECLLKTKGNFLSWDDDLSVKLCDKTGVKQIKITITVNDTDSNPVQGVQITYQDTNHDTSDMTDQYGNITLEINDKAKYQVVYFHKDGYTDAIKAIYALRQQGTITLAKLQDAEKPEVTPAGEYGTEAPGRTDTDETDENVKGDTNQDLSDKLKSARDALAAAKEKENSWANRGLTAASSAMTGLGAMQLAEGIAERRADAEAEKEMRAYIETMKCNYGGGQNIKLGNEEITLPGGNELLEYYTEYKSLADNLKTTKTALGLRPGIESETLYDRAQTGLYQYASIGKTGGAETSLYRALTDSESEDATAWSEQKETASKKLKVGGGVAAGGAAVGVIGNAAINTDMIQNIKDAFKKD